MGRTFTARATVAVLATTTVVTLGACSSSGSDHAKSSSRGTTSTSAATTTTTAPAVPRVTVSPNTNLHDGQGIDVSATGFPASTEVAVEQCADRGQQTTPGDCDLDKIVVLTSDGAGIVHTLLAVTIGPFGANKVTCAPPQRCLVLVSVVPGRTGINATAPITFAA